jgi:Spy/CpxP family protein refolding chaperone
MRLTTRTRFIGSIALAAATIAAAASAAPQPSAIPTPTSAPSAPAPSTCDTTAAPATPDTTQESDTTEGVVHRDPIRELVADALSKVCLSDDQRAAAEHLGKEVAPKEQAVADARHAFFTALLDQFKSGTIDAAALKDQIDALVTAREGASPVLRKALENLHGILDPGQRSAFVDAIQSRMKELTGASGAWFEALAKDLNLTDDQKSRIHDLLEKAKPQVDKERTTVGSALGAFKQDQFSIDAVAPMTDVGSKTRDRAEGMVALAKEMTDVLTPDQRATLASKIEGQAPASAPSKPPAPGPSYAPAPGPSYAPEPAPNYAPAPVPNYGMGQTQQGLVAGRASYHSGAVGGWGRGYGYRGGSVTSVRTGYASGYPIVGGYSPGYF